MTRNAIFMTPVSWVWICIHLPESAPSAYSAISRCPASVCLTPTQPVDVCTFNFSSQEQNYYKKNTSSPLSPRVGSETKIGRAFSFDLPRSERECRALAERALQFSVIFAVHTGLIQSSDLFGFDESAENQPSRKKNWESEEVRRGN